MAKEPTPAEAAETEETDPHTDLALVVAALGGGPGEPSESGARRRTASKPLPTGSTDPPRAEAA